jgi:hypothetical protein
LDRSRSKEPELTNTLQEVGVKSERRKRHTRFYCVERPRSSMSRRIHIPASESWRREPR